MPHKRKYSPKARALQIEWSSSGWQPMIVWGSFLSTPPEQDEREILPTRLEIRLNERVDAGSADEFLESKFNSTYSAYLKEEL